MNIGTILTQLGEGLASIVPAVFGAIYEGFAALFLTTSAEGGVTGFNELAVVTLSFFVLWLAYKLIPIVVSFISKKISDRKASKAANTAK